MKSFKRAAGLLAASYLVSASALDITFPDGRHQLEKPVAHHVRSTLEDLDLATREVRITIGPDGKRTITGMSEEEYNKFFETGPDGMPRSRGMGGFGSSSGFGRSSGFGSSPFGSSPFGSSPFGSDFFGNFGHPTQPRPTGRPQTQPQPATQPEEPSDESDEPEVDETSQFRDAMEDFFKRMGRRGSAPSGHGSTVPTEPTETPSGDVSGPTLDPTPKTFEPLKPVAEGGAPFRIVIEYDTLNAGISAKHAKYVKESLMPAIHDYFTAALKLKYPNTGKITAPNWANLSTACDGGIPRKYVTQGVEGDLVILTRISNAPQEGYVARAASCVFDPRSGRTLLSSINFNVGHIEVDEGNPLIHSKNIYTTLHELTHVLGFSGVLYENFLLPNGKPNRNVIVEEDGMTMVNVEPLTSKLRKHFGCDKIKGAPLENQGGSGSKGAHFERRVFFNEFMTASEVHDGKISEFTLALLEGTGWYNVDYNMAEPFHVGKGQGCDYFYGECMNSKGMPNFPEFCPYDGERLCSSTYNGVAICGQDQFSDGCGMPHVQADYDCRNPEAKNIAELLPEYQVFGPTANSKCFMGNLVPKGYRANGETTYCLNYKCSGTGANTTLDIIVGKSSAKCTKKGKVTVAGFSGNMDCPDPVEFCGMTEFAYCPRGCMGRGTCSDGKCQCKPGFTGIDCAYKA